MSARSALAISLAISLAGCASSDFMRDGPRPALTARSGSALVVFLRPEGTAPNTKVTLLDDRMRFLGDSLSSRCFAVTVDPGERMFVGWGANTAVLSADLQPGQVYFVDVSLRIGAVSTRTNLFASPPPEPARLEGCTFQTVDEAAGQRWLNVLGPTARDQIRRAKELWARYEEPERRRRRLPP